MDPAQIAAALLTAAGVPGQYAFVTFGVCALVSALIPVPASGPLRFLMLFVNALGGNFLRAKNAAVQTIPNGK